MPTVNYGIASTADDVSETRNASDGAALGYFDSFSYTGLDGGQQIWVGLRFLAVAVPIGSTITSATLTLKRDDGFGITGSAWGSIAGYAADTVGALTSNRPYAAAKTSATVTVTNSATVAYDVTAIIAEIIGRGGWASGNDLAFATIPTGANGYFAWIDRASSSTNCAQLSITYSAGGPASFTIDGAASGAGTATGAVLARRPLTGAAAGSGTAAGIFVPAPRTKKAYRYFPRFRGGADVWYDTASSITGPEFWDAAPSGGASYTIDGAASGLGTATGLVLRTAPVGSVAAGLAVATGLAGRSAPAVGTATGTGSATGDVGTQGGADGAATGTGAATGSVGVSRPLAGIASGSGAVTGAVLRLATINGVAVGAGTATGAVGRTAGVTAAASGTGTATGDTGFTGDVAANGSNFMTDRRRRRSAVR